MNLDKIIPSNKEINKVNKLINIFLKKIKAKLKDANPELGGSMAKNTWLSGDHDIDIFIKFPYSRYYDKDISKILQERLNGIKYDKMHGSRDYLQVKKGKYLFELIPVIDIKHSSRNLNITDVSPLHAKYVKEKNKNPNEIRLAKAFLKANNLYGAESYIKGFSGYVTELLIIYYNNFDNLIKNASIWKTQTIIDLNNYYKNENEILRNINKDKLSNLILIDPVQVERNAAAALSSEKYFEFINSCKKYLSNPSEGFFELKKFNLNDLRKKAKKNKLITFTIKPLDGKPDVIGSKILKIFNYIKDKINKEDFKILESSWEWKDDVLLYYIVKDEKLSKEIIHYGPFKNDINNLENFKKKWNKNKIYYDKEHVYIKLKRKYDSIEKYSKFLLKDNYVKDNLKEIKSKTY